jgi:hypothetical protein
VKLLLLPCVALFVCLCAAAQQPAAVPPPVLLTEKDAGKTVKASPGQRVEVHLRGTQAMTGWESITAPQKDALQSLSEDFVRDPAGNDAAIGTYVFRYQALKVGTVPFQFIYVYPGGPDVTSRKATKLVATFQATLEIRTPAR